MRERSLRGCCYYWQGCHVSAGSSWRSRWWICSFGRQGSPSAQTGPFSLTTSSSTHCSSCLAAMGPVSPPKKVLLFEHDNNTPAKNSTAGKPVSHLSNSRNVTKHHGVWEELSAAWRCVWIKTSSTYVKVRTVDLSFSWH